MMNNLTPRYVGLLAAVGFVGCMVTYCTPVAASPSEDLKYVQELNNAIAADLKAKKAVQKEEKAAVRLEKQKAKLEKACALLPDHPSCKK
jgi:hypothetical protein